VQIMRAIVEGLAAGSIHPLPLRTFPAAEAVAAFRTMQQARHIGKIVILQPVEPPQSLVRPDAAYLIIGGLRGLGLLSARWLAGQGARHLALMGRGEPGTAALAEIQAMQAAGASVRVFSADVSSAADVRRVLD